MLELDHVAAALAAQPPHPPIEETPPRAAAVAIIMSGREDPRLCFVERAARAGDRWSGDVAFPGGWANPSDSCLRGTAIRETHEEIGLVIGAEHHVGDLGRMSISRHGAEQRGWIGASVFHVGDAPPPVEPDGREIVDAFWLPVSYLLDPAHATTVPYRSGNVTEHGPGVVYHGRTIWGLTWRVFERFLTIAAAHTMERPGTTAILADTTTRWSED